MTLRLCPCSSGKLYEACCYKKKNSDGEPLFFKGAMSGDAEGNWHPIPNTRFKIILVTESVDKYRDFAKTLASKSKLPEKHRNVFINEYGLFYQSFEHLLESLRKSNGKGVSFQTDSIEVRRYWREFLFNGRVLCDFIGLHSRETLSLIKEVGGLNKKKFALLLNILQSQGLKDVELLATKARLEVLKESVLRFIDFRNKEKTSGDTILEFPVIDSEYGVVEGGKVSLDGANYNMIEFVKNSYDSIYKLTITLLGVK